MKKQFLTLALLATVAVGGAFAGNSTSDSRLGAAFNSTFPCSTSLKECSDIVDILCTYEISEGTFIRLYDNAYPAPGTCTNQLYEPQP